MTSYRTRLPLAIALSSALAFAVGCDHNRTDEAAMEPAGTTAAETTAADTTATEPAPPASTEPMAPADTTTPADTTAPATGDGIPGDGLDSAQPVDDTWITTKVKSSLLADTDVAGLQINVDTLNGVVTLAGEVEQQAQIDKAISIARGIKGVTDVQSTGLVVGPAN